MPEIKLILSKLRESIRLFKLVTPDPVLSTKTSNMAPSLVINFPTSQVPVPRNLTTKPKCASSQFNAPLENLPSEIRRQLLSILGLEGLRSLVHASPVFHQQYRLNRKFLLCKCLEMTFRSVIVDVCAVYRSSSAEFQETRTQGSVTEFMKSYENQRSSTKYSISTERFTEKDAVSIVKFHFSVIKPLKELYTDWALANLADETNDKQNHEPLSRTEETRLLRAMYRFELCCNLIGNGFFHKLSWYLKHLRHKHVEVLLETFICMYEPWEIEEIISIYAFSKEKHNQAFNEIRWDVHENNPKFDGHRGQGTPEGAFDLDNSFFRELFLEGTISSGLQLLHIVFTIRDHEHLVTIMQDYMSSPPGDFILAIVDEMWCVGRDRRQMSERDHKQDRRDPLPFERDTEDSLDPPLAWTLIWGGTYSNLYGYHVPDVMRRWGYVIWDATRLQQTNAKEVLARQWKAAWEEDDPRDYISI